MYFFYWRSIRSSSIGIQIELENTILAVKVFFLKFQIINYFLINHLTLLYVLEKVLGI